MSERRRGGVKTQIAPFSFLEFDVPPHSGGRHVVAEEGRLRLRLQEADHHHRSIFLGEWKRGMQSVFIANLSAICI